MDLVGYRDYYLKDLLQLVLVSILIVHNQIEDIFNMSVLFVYMIILICFQFFN